jgi:hypothetical protein
MDEPLTGNVSAYIADPKLFRYAKTHAARLQMTVSAYINLLLEIDCERDIARQELVRRISAPIPEPDGVAS